MFNPYAEEIRKNLLSVFVFGGTMKTLIITEKPSVAKAIAEAYGDYKKTQTHYETNDYYITWAVGHIVKLVDPEHYDKKYKKWDKKDLPIYPKEFLYEPALDQTLKQIKKLIENKSVTSLINACDADREGELIFMLIYNYLNCTKPYKRLWIADLLSETILKGMNNLYEGNYFENLYESALLRQHSDWLVGINLSRAASLTLKQNFSIGSVQTPLLKIIIDREDEINNFKKSSYFTVSGAANDITFSSKLQLDQTSAAQLAARLPSTGKITKMTTKINKIKPPELYNLSALQADANKKLSLSAAQVAEITQKLYENKIITYPRTKSYYLPSAFKDKMNTILPLESIKHFPDEIFNDSKVDGHHAIIPTGNVLPALTSIERDVYELIVSQLKNHFLGETLVEQTSVEVLVGDTIFTGSMSKNQKIGFHEPKENWQQFSEGDDLNFSFEVSEVSAKPPVRFDEGKLITLMEAQNLGTEATRAGIIERLKEMEYIVVTNKKIAPTAKGRRLVDSYPIDKTLPQTMSEYLQKIEKGDLSYKQVLTDYIKNYIEVNL